MKKFLLAAILFASSLALGQATRFDGQVTGPNGTPIHFPTVRLCDKAATQGSGTTFCSTLATTYSSIAATPFSGQNPFNGDFNGNFHAYAAPGRYILEVVVNGVVQYDIPDYVVACEAGVTCGGTAQLSGGSLNSLTVWTGPSAVTAALGLLDSGGVFSATDSVDFRASPSFKVPVSANPSPTANGTFAYDTVTNTAQIGSNGTTKTLLTVDALGATIVQTSASATFGAFAYDFTSAANLRIPIGTAANISARACSNGDLAVATDATAGQMLYECKAGVWTQQLNSGGAGGAATSLNNLASVAFNLALTPNVGNLGTANADIGSTAAPVDGVFIGGAATNNIKLTGTSAAARTATLPDNTGTIAETNFAQGWGATQTFSSGLVFSTMTSSSANPSLTGSLRLSTTDPIKARAQNNLSDIIIAQKDTNNVVQVGDTFGIKVGGPVTTTTSSTAIFIQPLSATGNNNGSDTTIGGGNGAGSGTNGNLHFLAGLGGTGGPGFIDFGTSGAGVVIAVDTATGVVANNTVVLSPTGNAIQAGAGTTSGVIGISTSTAVIGSATVIQFGRVNCIFDGTAVVGHFAGPSQTTAGNCTDAGLSPTGQTVGQVLSLVSGNTYSVLVNPSGVAQSLANVIVTNPGASQTIQPTVGSAIPLIVKQPASAGSQDIFQVLSSSGAKYFSITNTGAAVFGTGLSTVKATQFISSSNNPAGAGTLALASGDCIDWENNSTTNVVTLCKDNSDIFKLSNTTGLSVVLPSAATWETLLFVTPATSTRNITFPDPGANVNVVYDTTPQTLSGKTMASGGLTFAGQGSAPSNPAPTACTLYYDTGTSKLKAINDGGADCGFAGGGGSSALSAITPAGAPNTIANADFAQKWQWTLTTAAKSAFEVTEAAAATNGVASQFLTKIDTLAASTAFPLQVTARGTANGFQVDRITGNLNLIGTADVDLGTTNSTVAECANDGVTGTTVNLLTKLTTSNTCIKTATTDVAGVEGIVVAGAGTSGNAQIALSGVAVCTFSNTTTVGDYVVPSTVTAGDCADGGVNPTQGLQVLGRVLTSGLAATNQSVALYSRGLPALASGAAGMVTVSYAGGVAIFSLPQSIATNATVTFTNININNAGIIGGNANSSNISLLGGTNTNSSAINGSLTIRCGDMTGTGSSNVSCPVTIRGGNNSSTSTGNAGDVIIQGGHQNGTGATGHNGGLLFEGSWVKGGTYTTGNLQCFSADNTVADCGTSAINFVGVAVASDNTSAQVAIDGNRVTFNYDATVSPVAGWFLCSSAGTAGKVTAQSAACAAGRTAGIVEAGGTNVTSGLGKVVHF